MGRATQANAAVWSPAGRAVIVRCAVGFAVLASATCSATEPSEGGAGTGTDATETSDTRPPPPASARPDSTANASPDESASVEPSEPATSPTPPPADRTVTAGPTEGTAAGVTIRAEPAVLQAWLDEWRQEQGVSGAVAGVKIGDARPVVVASGSNGSTDEPLHPDAPFFIASVTKTFVAAAMLQLVEEGRVDLDAAASEYVDLWPAASRITIRQLLSHTSGLASLANLDSRDEWEGRIFADLRRAWTPEQALAVVAEDGVLFRPGTDYHYSNANFLVVGLVIEAVTGEPLADVLRARLTEPLGLDETYLHPGRGGIDPRIAHGVYSADGLEFDTSEQPLTAVLSIYGAAAAMVATPEDVLTWLRALYGTSDVLAPETVAEMYDPVTDRGLGTKGICPCSPDGVPYGLGHDGLFPGFDTLAAYYPLGDVSILVYVNDTPSGGILRQAIQDVAALLPVEDDD